MLKKKRIVYKSDNRRTFLHCGWNFINTNRTRPFIPLRLRLHVLDAITEQFNEDIIHYYTSAIILSLSYRLAYFILPIVTFTVNTMPFQPLYLRNLLISRRTTSFNGVEESLFFSFRVQLKGVRASSAATASPAATLSFVRT